MTDLPTLLAGGESLAVEFKSDRKCLPDRELIAAVVALANTDGGELLLGVEDDGTVTGLHSNHADADALAAMFAARTVPAQAVAASLVETPAGPVARFRVAKSATLVSSSEGLYLRRAIGGDGKPASVPMLPHEIVQRQSSRGQFDFTALVLPELTAEALDPIERARLRDAIRRFNGDRALLDLDDESFDRALRLVSEVDGAARPTLAGLLFIGREAVLRKHLPAHEAAFQVLHGTEVRFNLFVHRPLVRLVEEFETLFLARNDEREYEVGLFRVPVPDFDKTGFREALVNAFVHRDYARLGAVHVRLDDAGLSVSSPGGFVEGVTPENLLVTEPRPRNPLLADIAKRVGLAERTGRGIDRIYEGVLRYGRPAPDYSGSNTAGVTVRLDRAPFDKGFLERVLSEEARTGQPLPVDTLMVLSRLHEERRLSLHDLAGSIQKSESRTRAQVEKLVEAGLLAAHGEGRARVYTLAAALHLTPADKAGYVRQAGFSAIQREQMVLNYIDAHGAISRSDAVELCRVSETQASRLLKQLEEKGLIVGEGRTQSRRYRRPAGGSNPPA